MLQAIRSLSLLSAALVASFVISPGTAQAQEYPTRAITLIVPFTPGGSTSIIARAVADRMSESLKQPIVLENRPGAGTTIGARAVAKAAPDGYTLLMGTNATLTIALELTRNPGFTRKDLASVGFIGSLPNVVVVHPGFPARSMAELIDYAKKKGEPIQFGSPGIGTVNHLAGELIAHTAGIKLAHVPYRGAVPALTDLMGGHIPLLLSGISNVHSHIETGKVRALAVTSIKRSALLPKIPTVAESGLPGFDASLSAGFLAPAGTPRPIIDRLNREMRAALASEMVRKALAREGVETLATSPEEFTAIIDREEPLWAGLIKKIGMVAK